MKFIRGNLLIVMLVLAGCATRMPVTHVDDWPGHETIAAPSAVAALVKQASAQRQQRLYQEAIYTLERALRIAPDEPLIYQQMAWVRYEQQRYSEAEQLARRGLSLSHSEAQRQQFKMLLEKITRDET